VNALPERVPRRTKPPVVVNGDHRRFYVPIKIFASSYPKPGFCVKMDGVGILISYSVIVKEG
jgi:hypothetical protein